jgi:threonine dehydratase
MTDKVSTFADGIQVKNPGDLTFEIIKEKVDGMFTVSEDEIAAAILKLIEKQKLVAEGAGAVSVAAAMFDKLPIEGKNVACVISGGNIDVNILSRVITRGLMMEDRKIAVTLEMDDTHGRLARACQIVSECGGNILEVIHDRGASNISINRAYVTFELEMKDAAQSQKLRETFEAEGYNLIRS